MKIRAMGVELLHAFGQTDMMKLIDAFRIVAKVTTNWGRSKMGLRGLINV
jgi:hypothetical protein